MKPGQLLTREWLLSSRSRSILKGLGASGEHPSGVIGDVPTLIRSEHALLCKSVMQYLQGEHISTYSLGGGGIQGVLPQGL